jgi:integrase/recombinase XerD
LTVNDIELPKAIFPDMQEVGYLHILGTQRKKERVIPLNYKACIALDNYLDERPKTTISALFLNRFEKPLGARGVEKIVSKYCSQIGLKGVNIQTLRHTFGTHQVAKGTSIDTVQKVMGYRDRQSTALYTDLANAIMEKELQDHSL